MPRGRPPIVSTAPRRSNRRSLGAPLLYSPNIARARRMGGLASQVPLHSVATCACEPLRAVLGRPRDLTGSAPKSDKCGGREPPRAVNTPRGLLARLLHAPWALLSLETGPGLAAGGVQQPHRH